jgi:hypothetical protein
MKIAKSRAWTQGEIDQAIAAIKRVPGLWEELMQIEAATGDFNVDAGLKAERIIMQLHPECELNEITDLKIASRLSRRAELGIK